jgi:large subunit ribosomal protein L21
MPDIVQQGGGDFRRWQPHSFGKQGRLERVLALGSATETKIGRPHLPAPAAVLAAVEEFFDDAKALHFHKRRRKNSRRLTGHRQPLTALRVLRVEGVEP